MIYTTMAPMAKLIDERYLPRIAKAKAEGDERTAKRLQKIYDEHALNPARIQAMLEGNFKDANWLNNWVESYFYSADDVVGGFTVWLTKHLSEVDAKSMRRYGSFLDDVVPKMKKLGYNPNDINQLLKWIAVEDTVGYTDDKGNFSTRKGLFSLA